MKRRKAVFTIVKDEKVMLPIWLKYYSQHFDPEDMFILDHQTTDGSTDNLSCNRRCISSDSAFNHEWLNWIVRQFQIELLMRYEYVLFVECDEIVYHAEGVGKYMDFLNETSVSCNGYEIQHLPEIESPLELSSPILRQRSYWYPSINYCKTLISSVPTRWYMGFHNCKNPGNFDRGLYLVHLHRFDYNLALAKNQERARMKWSEEDLELGRGFQNRIVGEEFDEWFYSFRLNHNIQKITPRLKEKCAF